MNKGKVWRERRERGGGGGGGQGNNTGPKPHSV